MKLMRRKGTVRKYNSKGANCRAYGIDTVSILLNPESVFVCWSCYESHFMGERLIMKKRKIYPVVVTREGDDYKAHVPDFPDLKIPAISSFHGMEDRIHETLQARVDCMVGDQVTLPSPTDLESLISPKRTLFLAMVFSERG